MKKIIALMAALVLALAISLSAVAEEQTNTLSFCGNGIILTVPEEFDQAQGLLYPMDVGEIDPGRKIACGFIYYIPLSKEDQALLTQSENTEMTEEQKNRITELFGQIAPLYYFFSVGNDKSFEDVQDAILQGDSPDLYNQYELGQAGEYRFYLLTLKPDSEEVQNAAAQFPDNDGEEYLRLLQDADTLRAAITVQEPVKSGAGAVGSVFSFELNDFSGKPVRSEDLFAGHKVTLVNLWASWCGPCAAEMPELEALWQEYGAKGAGFAGICLDGYKEKSLDTAKQVVAEGGVTYPQLACTEELEKTLLGTVVTAYPTTVFVNEKGEIIGEPIVGVNPEAYRTTLEEFLAE